MQLLLERISSDSDSSLGIVYINNVPECVTVEDEYRADKLRDETRIPRGEYRIKLRTVGGFHERYRKAYGDTWHKGMLWLQDVPGFEFILIHKGNTDSDTSGCILVGTRHIRNGKGGGTVTESAKAYEKLYPKVRDAILRGDKVSIKIVDNDR